MGSVASTPKAPAASPQIVYVPTPTTQVVSAPEASVPDPVADAALVRKAGLLSRDRSVFGTVVTGFRGFLGQKDATAQRKTLLGE
jgi:hypothetical protein